jgi:multidrug efflux system outer membrane protein
MVSLNGSREQVGILTKGVASAQRSNDLSTLRYREGFSSYQRVLDSQQSLFSQQQRLVDADGAAVRSLVALYKALGGGWENQAGRPIISEQSQEQMSKRINWGDYLKPENLQNRQ